MSMREEELKLKAILFELLRGNGGATSVLYLLRDIFQEMAQDQRDVLQNEHKAAVCEKLARDMERAGNKALAILELHP